MRRSLHQLRRYIKSPATQFATGLILLISGLASAYDEFFQADNTFRLGVHHGVALWALVQVLNSLPDLIDGIERSFDAIEKRREA